jgi:hypothetical protein
VARASRHPNRALLPVAYGGVGNWSIVEERVVAEPRVYVIHENPEWLPPVARALDSAGVLWSPWLVDGSPLDLSATPPVGVFWSRMSASAHTRGHGPAVEQARGLLAWLEAHGRRVVNGRRVLDLELSKIDQLLALSSAGFDVPRTVAVADDAALLAAAADFATPFLTKPNRGGKGLGVERFGSAAELATAIADPHRPLPIDGITLVQEYLPPSNGTITRVEIVGGEFLYAISADVARGGFQLCPADACAIDGNDQASLFSLRERFNDPIVERYLQFANANGIEVAGIEFLETRDGRQVTYDINTNTNYNPDVEAGAPRKGPDAAAEFLGRLLAEIPITVGADH